MNTSRSNQFAAETIRAERARRGWNRTELAHRTGIQMLTLGRIERLERVLRLDELERIANAFGMTPSAFVPSDAVDPAAAVAA